MIFENILFLCPVFCRVWDGTKTKVRKKSSNTVSFIMKMSSITYSSSTWWQNLTSCVSIPQVLFKPSEVCFKELHLIDNSKAPFLTKCYQRLETTHSKQREKIFVQPIKSIRQSHRWGTLLSDCYQRQRQCTLTKKHKSNQSCNQINHLTKSIWQT